MVNKIGKIEKLLTGEYQSPFSRKNIKLPIDEIVITSSILNYQFRHFEKFENKKNLIIFIGDSKLIIHNAKFDIGFINHEIQRLENSNRDIYDNLPYKEIKSENIIDTLEIAKNLYPGKSVSLDSLCIKFGINNKRKGKHGALIDSEILSEVYLELTGGKQPGFKFLQVDFDTDDGNKETIEKRNFIRKHPLTESRVSQKEMKLHIEFISEMKKNLWY